MSVVYLANSFPEAVEPYVWEEIRELRLRQVEVVTCAMRPPKRAPAGSESLTRETLYVFPVQIRACAKATWILLSSFWKIGDLIWRAVRGPETLNRRLRTLLHTWLGAYLAAVLERRNVTHIHVHHGYYSAWAGMVAARLLGAGFSMTLHGSDLLVRADYLDAKLGECSVCFTISEFNRRHILQRYPAVDASRVLVQRLGIDPDFWRNKEPGRLNQEFSILCAGRLHPVKNHGFLILACHALQNQGVSFRCTIAGEGEEHDRLQALIVEFGLQDKVTLLGEVSRGQLHELYRSADVVVLASHSEGIPITLMEAMAMERIVIGPRLSGLPELVCDGENGFLYTPESMEDFLTKLQLVIRYGWLMQKFRRAARQQVLANFNGPVNLAEFAAQFIECAIHLPDSNAAAANSHENPLLQQI